MVAPPNRPLPTIWAVGIILAIASIVLAIIGILTNASSGVPAFLLTLAPGALALILWMVRLQRQPELEPMPVHPRSEGVMYRPPPPPPNTSIYTTAGHTRPVAPTPRPQVDPTWLARDSFYSALEQPTGIIRCFITPKHDSTDMVECEDSYALDAAAVAFRGFGPGAPTRLVVALSDGVSGSELPRPWGRLLAQKFVEDPGVFREADALAQALPTWGKTWGDWVSDTWFATLNGRPPDQTQDVDFFRRLHEGAQATLTGCVIEAVGDHRVRVHVLAVGDSDCFLFRRMKTGIQLVAPPARGSNPFPIATAAQFTPNPHTFSTNPRFASASAQRSKQMTFEARYDDRLVLATDSVAEWLLHQLQGGGELGSALLTAENDAAFKSVIETARTMQGDLPALKDDDVTLMIIPLIEAKPGKARQ